MPKSENIEPIPDWTGFYAPNFTTIPDDFFDKVMPYLGEAELRVLLYMMRRTFGFKRASDDISLSQIVNGIVKRDGERLDLGAGVKERAAVNAIASLEARGIIVVQRNTAANGAKITSTYTLRMSGTPSAPNADTSRTPSAFGADTSRTKDRRVSAPNTDTHLHQEQEQETAIQETAIQDTVSDSNLTDAGKNEVTKYSPWIAGIIEDYSREMGEPNGVAINISRTMRMWSESGLSEADFAQVLRHSRDLTRQAQGAQGNGTIGRKMAYFFAVVADQAGARAGGG